MNTTNLRTNATSMPFGKYEGVPFGNVPSDYLAWLLRAAKLSTGLRSDIAAELVRRGQVVPPVPPPRPVRPCHDHPDAGVWCLWTEDRLGRKRIRAECRKCRRATDYPPCVPPHSLMADALASPAPILDTLVALDELGVSLQSDGATVRVKSEDWRKVPANLHAKLRQCRHQLAVLMGANQRVTR